MFHVLVCGSREWNDYYSIRRELESLIRLHGEITVIHGACKGADLLAELIAKHLEVNYGGFPAKWNKHGRAAGPIRNSEMLTGARPIDLVLAFHKDLRKSEGTKDMVKKAEKVGIKVVTINGKRELL